VADNSNKLSVLGTVHFHKLYKALQGYNLAEIINTASHFPRFVDEDEAEELNCPVTLGELEGTLKWFKKDKNPGPDGWLIKFYISFFEILGDDLLKVVEEFKTLGSLYNAMPDSPSSFNDFQHILLCNCLYNIIAKIIANCIRPILSHHISPEKYAFLEHRQIHEAIGTA